jgi:hypothetical protein
MRHPPLLTVKSIKRVWVIHKNGTTQRHDEHEMRHFLMSSFQSNDNTERAFPVQLNQFNFRLWHFHWAEGKERAKKTDENEIKEKRERHNCFELYSNLFLFSSRHCVIGTYCGMYKNRPSHDCKSDCDYPL